MASGDLLRRTLASWLERLIYCGPVSISHLTFGQKSAVFAIPAAVLRSLTVRGIDTMSLQRTQETTWNPGEITSLMGIITNRIGLKVV
jgi:hypothetical protein